MQLKHVLQVGLLVFAGPVAAQDQYISFQSPTGNIHCAIYSWDYDDDGPNVEARCDLLELTPSYRKRPASCEFDWGSAFAVSARGKGQVACVSDTVVDRRNSVLPYGDAVSLDGISCVSAKTGMTCTNAAGHGFSVSKAKQRIY